MLIGLGAGAGVLDNSMAGFWLQLRFTLYLRRLMFVSADKPAVRHVAAKTKL
jgi:hypothetical protein